MTDFGGSDELRDEALRAHLIAGGWNPDRMGNWDRSQGIGLVQHNFLAGYDAALAAAEGRVADAWDEGQKSGMRHADRMRAAYEMGRPELPGPPSPNPYRAASIETGEHDE